MTATPCAAPSTNWWKKAGYSASGRRRAGADAPVRLPAQRPARFSQNLLDQGSHPTSEKLLLCCARPPVTSLTRWGSPRARRYPPAHPAPGQRRRALFNRHYFADLTLWPTLQRFDSGSLTIFCVSKRGLRCAAARRGSAPPRPGQRVPAS